MIQLVIGLILASLMAVISYWLKALSLSGAIGTLFVGTIIFGLGGWIFAVPLLAFFVSSIILSHLKSEKKIKSQSSIEKAGARDIYQVFANGGVATACVIIAVLTDDSRWFYIYLASLGAATADTWATEIGTLISGKPRSITTFERVPPGESGGISIPGTIASFLGSAFTVCSILPLAYYSSNMIFIFYAIIAGFVGSIADSILGAAVQGGYKCSICGNRTESRIHCDKSTTRVKGLVFINNDTVNVFSNFIAASVIYLLMI